MKLKYKRYQIIPPCKKCPYTLGQVHTVTNPCPQCKMNGYNMYEQFRELAKGQVKKSMEAKSYDD